MTKKHASAKKGNSSQIIQLPVHHDSGADAPPANGDQQRTAKKGSLLQQIRVRDRSGCSERRHVSTGKTKDKYDKVHAVKNAFH